MADDHVRTLDPDELVAAARIVAQGMLGDLRDEVAEGWAQRVRPEECHGAFAGDQLVGVARWFPDEISVPGGSLPAAGVTSVAVLPTHRRQGHLRRLMEAQLSAVAAAGIPVASLVAAEWPIYGRFGYGPAVDACGFEIDTRAAAFKDPPSGAVELVTAEELRPHLEAVHARRWERSAGSLRRPQAHLWDHLAGVRPYPGTKAEPGAARRAVWRDADGSVRGAVAYEVEERFVRNRPAGTATTDRLFGETPEAERELWRHLCELDWVTTVRAGMRAVDDPLPLFLVDGRAAARVDWHDHIWVRLLDLPMTFDARRAPVEGRAVLEVADPLGYTAGRWLLELGPDQGSATPTDEEPVVWLGTDALAAAFFGGQSIRRLADAGWIRELRPGAADALSALLATPTAPFATTSY